MSLAPMLGTAALVAATLLTGCAPQAFISSAGDYSAYRATRVGKTFEERLAASQRYLTERPTGAFRDEVRASFDPAEEAFYVSKRGDRVGLEDYLAALPAGPHHAQVKAELDGIVLAARSRSEDMALAAADAESRAAGPSAFERARVRKELADWIGRFLDAAVFRAPLIEAKAALIVPWSLSLPAPRCTPIEPPQGLGTRRCEKLVEMRYSVLVQNKPEPREALLAITVIEDPSGTPLEVTLGGPDLFARIEETYKIKPIAPSDQAEREAAEGRISALVRDAFAREISADPACKRRTTAPELVHRSCQGMRILVRASAAAGGDDQIVISPERPFSPERP